MKKHLDTIAGVLLLAVLLCAAGWTLLHYDSDFLRRVEEQGLFMSGHLFFAESMQLPGGLLTWCAAYLTQYFYNPTAGVAILLAIWGVTMLSMQRATRLPVGLWGLLVLVPAALLASIVQMGYFTFYVKLQGYFFAATLGMLFVGLLMWAYRALMCCKWAAWVLLAVAAVVGYPLCGAYALLATLAMGAMGVVLHKGVVDKAIAPVLAIALVAVVPLVYYNIYTTVHQGQLWVAALPCLQSGNHDFYTLRYAYYVLAVTPFVLVAAGRLAGLSLGPLVARLEAAASVAAIALSVWGVSAMWFHDELFDRELRMYACADRGDWEGVLHEARGGFELVPTRLMVMYKNLAMWKLGRSGNEMFTYRDGATKPKVQPTHYTNNDGERVDTVRFTVRLPQVGGKLMYFNYGKANYCYRWGMEDAVEFGWRIENIKYMVKSCLVNHEWALASRYLAMLSRTRNYREWAERYAQFMYHPQRIEEDAELGAVHRLMCYANRLDGDEAMVELYIMRTFANGNSDQLEFQELTLINALLTQDIDLFWPRFVRYAQLHPDIDHMPTHYQEAAYLYGHLENKVDISHMPFDESVKQSYAAFMDFNRQCGAMSEQQKAVAFYPRFGRTFYYFYFFSRNMTTY